MLNSFEKADATELAAAINAAASIMAKGKLTEEVEMLAILAHMLGETLHSIVRVERMQRRLNDERERIRRERMDERRDMDRPYKSRQEGRL